MLQALTETDKSNIRHYIAYYAVDDCSLSAEDVGNVDTILTPWSESKQKLYELFDNKLILSKPYSTCDLETIQNTISRTTTHRFVKNYLDKIKEITNYNNVGYTDLYLRLQTLVQSYFLATNIYDGNTIIVEVPNSNSKLKLERGGKIYKFLQKMAKTFEIEGIEDFMNWTSQLINTYKMSGELCISIHPLDYFTMSDNAHHWQSCMSWVANGCYKQGTVEMLNSPCVVVAYLASKDEDKEFELPNGNTWNSKKWRCLYIVDENIIAPIKSYPRVFPDLEEQVGNWLAQIMKNKGFGEFKKTNYVLNYSSDKDKFIFGPGTEYMYNDFFNKGISQYNCWLNKEYDITQPYVINYSGVNECVICGSVDSIEHPAYLHCDQCHPVRRCDHCGRVLFDDDDCYYTDYGVYCCECYDNLIFCRSCDSEVSSSSERWRVEFTDKYGWWATYDYCNRCMERKLAPRWNEITIDPTKYTINKDCRVITIDKDNLTKEGLDFIEYLN